MMKSTSSDFLELLINSFRCLPKRSVLSLFLHKVLPFRRRFFLTKLPNDYYLIVPNDEVESVWKNILHIFYFKDYEKFSTFVPKPGWFVIDVGAYIGIWTLRIASKVGNKGMIIAFEPNPYNFVILKMNLKINNVKNVIARNLAVSAQEGTSYLYVPELRINSTLNLDYALSLNENISKINVKTVTLSKFIKELNISKIDLLKVDTEGNELEILRDLESLLETNVIKRIVIEAHTNVTSIHELIEIFEDKDWFTVISYTDLPFQVFIYAYNLRS